MHNHISQPIGGDKTNFLFYIYFLLLCIYYRGVAQDAVAADHNEAEGKEVDPQNGRAAMWLTVTSQWICLFLYNVRSESFHFMYYIYRLD